MPKVLELITCGEITLVPFDKPTDFDYLVDLAMKYKWNRVSREQMYRLLRNYGRYFWNSYYKDQKYGVGYICYNDDIDIWTIDLYRDNALCKALDRKAEMTFRPGQVLIKHIFETTQIERLFGITDAKNRALLMLAKRLGFKFCRDIDTIFGKFRMIVRDRED